MKRLFTLIFAICLCSTLCSAKGIKSFETPYTILKVRDLNISGEKFVLGSGYYGELICMNYSGKILWDNKLSGFVNNDIYCRDIDKDGNDEIFVASASGELFCLNSDGKELWRFSTNEVPLVSVTVVGSTVVTGGNDKNIYYLSLNGKLLNSYPIASFAITKPWGNECPKKADGAVNFLRTVRNRAGKEFLALHSTTHSMSTSGALYLINVKPREDKIHLISANDNISPNKNPIGACVVSHTEGEPDKLLMGGSSMIDKAAVFETSIFNKKPIKSLEFKNVKKKGLLDNFGYRVGQVERVKDGYDYRYFALFGSRIFLLDENFGYKPKDVLISKYSFFDLWQDNDKDVMLLASAQSGGNCIHIIDLKDKNWEKEYQNLTPKGNITAILKNTNTLKKELTHFQKPEWEKSNQAVYFMSENLKNEPAKSYEGKYKNAIFLDGDWTNGTENPKEWNRDTMSNKKYRLRREGRKKYDLTSKEAEDMLLSSYKHGSKYGYAYWAGHGNDPFYVAPRTLFKVLDNPITFDTKTVLIYPELEDHSKDFGYVMDVLIHPLADYIKQNKRDINLYIRTKDIFWSAGIYGDNWNWVLDGDYPEVFIPAMEETSDRMMELSVAARLGVWSSGAFDSWGSRGARDNPSYDRLRQHSHQMLPNHFLRMLVYHISYGAQYLDNFAVDQEYMSILWDMVGKGLIYVPRPEEIVSYSPLSMSMMQPDEDFLSEGSLGKWLILYDKEVTEKRDNMVFSRLNPTWAGGKVNEWDFSSYAAGVKDRRLNFLAPYSNGMVLLAPSDDPSKARGNLSEHLHPMYKDIMKRIATDGKYYYVDGKKHSAPEYSPVIKEEIEKLSQKLPMTVSGDVAWVAAQTAEKHIRLTIIDSGYLNPSEKTATVTFHTIKPINITDLATGKKIRSKGKTLTIDIPVGLFRFLDISF